MGIAKTIEYILAPGMLANSSTPIFDAISLFGVVGVIIYMTSLATCMLWGWFRKKMQEEDNTVVRVWIGICVLVVIFFYYRAL